MVLEFATGSIKILDLKRFQIAGGATFKIMQIGLLVLILGLFEDLSQCYQIFNDFDEILKFLKKNGSSFLSLTFKSMVRVLEKSFFDAVFGKMKFLDQSFWKYFFKNPHCYQ